MFGLDGLFGSVVAVINFTPFNRQSVMLHIMKISLAVNACFLIDSELVIDA